MNRPVLNAAVFVVLVLLSGLPLPANPAESESRPLVFGFLPIVSTERLVERFSPLVDYLAAQLEVPVRFETAPDFEEFIRRTGEEQRYDILFTAPHLYYLAQKEHGYRALVRVDLPGMRAVIVAPVSSDILAVEDLRGRSLATVDRLALATMLVKQHLEQAGLDPGKDLELVETPSHNAALLSTYQGRTDAAGLILPIYLRADPAILAGTRIIAKTATSPHMPVSVAPWISDDMYQHISKALLDLSATEQGREVLRLPGWPGFTAVEAGDYDVVKWAAEKVGDR